MYQYLPWFLRTCLNCAQGPSFTDSSYYSRVNADAAVKLDVKKTGNSVIILKEGERICGTGTALATAPLAQNKSYWEIHIQQTGSWSIGIANAECDLNQCPPNNLFWGLNEKGELKANNEVMATMPKTPEEGDTIGITYDHLELKFYVNGELASGMIANVRGSAYPAIFVDDSAVIDVKFDDFAHTPPKDFSEILLEQTIL